MIKDCPYKNNCNGIDCNKEFCMKKYRLDTLYEASLLSPIQREYKKLHTERYKVTNEIYDYLKFTRCFTSFVFKKFRKYCYYKIYK